MCLAVPGKIIEMDGVTARVDFGGITREANLTLVPGAAVDSYVLVHAGFAIQVLNEAEAEETLDLLRQMAGALDDEDQRRAVEPRSDVGGDVERDTERGDE
jgi:hydrogenase expression/formation protein HypC